jgi:hypothetical protein
MNPTEQAHQQLKSVLLNGRILLNGAPLTGNEISGLLQSEQTLYEKATQLGKLVAAQNAKRNPEKKPEKKKE